MRIAIRRIASFHYAFEGILTALKEEPNLLIQLLIGLVGLVLGVYFHITSFEWLIGIIAFGLVFSMELTNTAIEEIVDSFTQNSHPSAKKAKDVAAGAVVVLFFVELFVGLFIFLPYIFRSFEV